MIEVVGYKGVVGGATYEWLCKMQPCPVVGRDMGDPAPSYRDGRVSFICVPEGVVPSVAKDAASYAEFLVIRSTVKPGTCRALQDKLKIHICHVPEFLREVSAVQDEFNPNFIVIGACCNVHAEYLSNIYKNAQCRVVITDTATSELVKLAVNNYLSCLISYWNEFEKVAQAAGSNGHRVGAIASLDPRISTYGSRYHHKFGGKCLPKDLKQIREYALELNITTPLFDAIEEVNECAR